MAAEALACSDVFGQVHQCLGQMCSELPAHPKIIIPISSSTEITKHKAKDAAWHDKLLTLFVVFINNCYMS